MPGHAADEIARRPAQPAARPAGFNLARTAEASPSSIACGPAPVLFGAVCFIELELPTQAGEITPSASSTCRTILSTSRPHHASFTQLFPGSRTNSHIEGTPAGHQQRLEPLELSLANRQCVTGWYGAGCAEISGGVAGQALNHRKGSRIRRYGEANCAACKTRA